VLLFSVKAFGICMPFRHKRNDLNAPILRRGFNIFPRSRFKESIPEDIQNYAVLPLGIPCRESDKFLSPIEVKEPACSEVFRHIEKAT